MKKKNKRERNKKFFIVFIMVIFLVSSIGSVMVFYGDSAEKFSITSDDKKYTFTAKADSYGNRYYEVNSKDDDFNAYYRPEQIYIDIDDNSRSLLQNTNFFYLSFDPGKEDLSLIDFLRFDLGNNMPPDKYFSDSVTEKSDLYQFPVVSCENATSETPVLILESRNSTTNITSSGGCISIDFFQQDVLQVRDMLVYLLRGIK